MKKLLLIVQILLIHISTLSAQEYWDDIDLSKHQIYWKGDNNIAIHGKNGNFADINPLMSRTDNNENSWGMATLDLRTLDLNGDAQITFNIQETSFLLGGAPKRKQGIGEETQWGVVIYYNDDNATPKQYEIAFYYNYFTEKNSNYCEVKYNIGNTGWQPMEYTNLVNFVFEKHASTLTLNSNPICNDIKAITGIGIALSVKAHISIGSFKLQRESGLAKTEKVSQQVVQLLDRQDFKGAIDVTTRAIDEISFKNPDLYRYRGHALANMNYYKSAIVDYQKALEIYKELSDTDLAKLAIEEIYYFMGMCYLALEDESNAIESFKNAGFKGELYLRENTLQNKKSSIHNDSIRNATNIRADIEITKSTTKLSPTDIFNKYNHAVFMVLTSSDEGIAQGSGFFIGKNGLAISNYHVFEGAIRGREQVKLMNGGTYQIKEILGYDKERDYIIFRVDGNGFTHIPITKRGYEIGDEVYAIGSPKGMQNTLSNGLISQKWDDTKFQISVPIDHGSSGGALINQYGEVIGITSGGRDDTHANLNYAVDIRTIFNQNE